MHFSSHTRKSSEFGKQTGAELPASLPTWLHTVYASHQTSPRRPACCPAAFSHAGKKKKKTRNFPGFFSRQRCRLSTSVTIFTWGGNFKQLFFVKWKQSFSGFTCSIVLCIADKTHLQVFISILTDFPDKDEINMKKKQASISKWPAMSYMQPQKNCIVLL